MAAPTKAQLATARAFLARADRRINGAAKAATRSGTDPGEFDNNFDGVVTAIFHVVDAYELATTGIKRRVGEAEQATRIESVLASLRAARTPNVPPGSRLIDLYEDSEPLIPGLVRSIPGRRRDSVNPSRGGQPIWHHRRQRTLGCGPHAGRATGARPARLTRGFRGEAHAGAHPTLAPLAARATNARTIAIPDAMPHRASRRA